MKRRHPIRSLIVLLALSACPIVTATETVDEMATNSIVVGIKEAPPFVIRSDDGAWSGLAVKLWEQIADSQDRTYEYVEYDLSGLLAAVESGEVDVAVGALTMTHERELLFDFTHSYFTSGLGIAVKRHRAYGLFHALEGFFSLSFIRVMTVLVVVLLACGLLVWIFERKKNPEMFGGPAHSGIGSGFWWAAVTMTTVGYGDKAPKTPGGRAIALFWMFGSLIIISGFTAAIASALTVGALASPITGPGDLLGSRVMSISDSSSEDWLRRQGIAFIPVPTVEAGLEGLELDQADAMVYDAPILNYRVRNDPSGKLMVLPGGFEYESYGFALPAGSLLTEELNREILEITTGDAWREHIRVVVGFES